MVFHPDTHNLEKNRPLYFFYHTSILDFECSVVIGGVKMISGGHVVTSPCMAETLMIRSHVVVTSAPQNSSVHVA